jgi:protein involved in polysaccharide export with SLBB domain
VVLGAEEANSGKSAFRFSGGERIRLLVSGMSGDPVEQLVSDDGFIALPIGATLNIKGKTISEAHQLLKEALKEEAATKRVVGSIAIVSVPERRVYISGEVRTPQSVVLPPGQRLSMGAAVAAAGGPTNEADLSRVRLARGDCGDKCRIYDLSQIEVNGSTELGPVLEMGDVVHVPRAEIFIVAGEVATPGAYTRRQLSLTPSEPARFSRVLLGAGGLKTAANTGDLRLIRTNPDGTQQIVSVKLHRALEASQSGAIPVSATNGDAADPILKSGDVIVASATGGVSVFGQVQRPGVYPTGGKPMKLTRVLAAAGGFTRFAKTSAVTVVRASAPNSPERIDVNSITKDGAVDRDILLDDGDMAFIGERTL